MPANDRQGRLDASRWKTYFGIVVTDELVKAKHESGPLQGARASVETAGDVERRVTATRLLLGGPLALAFRKARDRRQMHLVIEGDGYSIVQAVDPKRLEHARKLAAYINSRSGPRS